MTPHILGEIPANTHPSPCLRRFMVTECFFPLEAIDAVKDHLCVEERQDDLFLYCNIHMTEAKLHPPDRLDSWIVKVWYCDPKDPRKNGVADQYLQAYYTKLFPREDYTVLIFMLGVITICTLFGFLVGYLTK